MKFGDDGRLYAINPRPGFFGRRPRHRLDTNANAMETLGQLHLHQHRAHRRR
jgi:GTP-dependent phosphoenolpyruvate carboxykinase